MDCLMTHLLGSLEFCVYPLILLLVRLGLVLSFLLLLTPVLVVGRLSVVVEVWLTGGGETVVMAGGEAATTKAAAAAAISGMISPLSLLGSLKVRVWRRALLAPGVGNRSSASLLPDKVPPIGEVLLVAAGRELGAMSMSCRGSMRMMARRSTQECKAPTGLSR